MLFYHDSNTQIYCGDCRDILPTIPAVSAVISDPPYGVGLAAWDIPIDQEALDRCLSMAPIVMLFGAAPPRCMTHMLSLKPLCNRVLIWHNPRTATISDGFFWKYQPIYVWGKMPGTCSGADVMIECCNDDFGRVHSAQKPENLMRRLILAACPNGGTVLDPWCGSGTTLVAAKALGMKSIGIEMDKDTCSIAAERISNEARQHLLFENQLDSASVIL